IVTRCSCIASSSADCVFGGVRLISSASTMLLKMGPGENTIWRRPVDGSSWMMSVPVMSDGIRSGVNWMRVNFRSSTWASVAMSSVFARPGTPTIKLLPPTNSVCNTSSMTSDWPMIRLPSSVMIACRPTFILSASAMSSAESKSTVCSRVTRALLVSWRSCSLMSHPVNHVIDADLVGLVRFVNRLEAGVGPLPVLRNVGVEIRQRDNAFARIVVLEDRPEHRRATIVILRDIERFDFEKNVIHGIRNVEVDPLALGEHAAHLLLEVHPVRPPVVIEEHKPAFQQVRPELRGLLVGHVPAARLAHVRNRIPRQVRIVERHDVRLLGPRTKIGNLVQNLREMYFTFRIIVRPADALGLKGNRRTVAQPDEGKPPVVGEIRRDRGAAAAAKATTAATPLAQRRACDGHHQHGDDGPLHFFACRSRMAFVFNARSVSSLSIWAS